jgi:hypothetical protein
MSDWGRPDFVMLSGLAVLLLAGVVTPEQAFAGFSNSAVLTVGALYIVAGGVQHTNALSRLDTVLFSRASGMGGLLRAGGGGLELAQHGELARLGRLGLADALGVGRQHVLGGHREQLFEVTWPPRPARLSIIVSRRV